MLTVTQRGWNALALAVKIPVRLWGKPHVSLAPRRSNRKEVHGVMPFVIQRFPSGFARFRRSKSCGRSGCSMISGSLMLFVGVPLSLFLNPLAPWALDDEEASASKKRSTTWGGSNVHLTESGEAPLPVLLTHVQSTAAPVSDDAMTATLPAEHMGETGDGGATLLVESERHNQRDLVGSPCTNEVITITCATKECQMCPSRSRCTQSIRHTVTSVHRNQRKPGKDKGSEAGLCQAGGE